MTLRGFALTVLLHALCGCAASPSSPAPSYPPFRGIETDSWLAYQVELPERGPNDLLPSFEASARSFGCHTDHLGGDSRQTIGGELRSFYGISAWCDGAGIALITLVGGGVRIGCSKPTTRERCDALLQQISDAR
jgi:hypothetical protein